MLGWEDRSAANEHAALLLPGHHSSTCAVAQLAPLPAHACRAQDGSSGGGDASTRLLSTLLTEMDGMELATGVLVLAATNRWAEGQARGRVAASVVHVRDAGWACQRGARAG